MKSESDCQVTRPSEANVMGNNNAKNGKVAHKNKSTPSDNLQEAVETRRNETTVDKCEHNSTTVSDPNEKVKKPNDTSTTTAAAEPKKESYVKQLFDVRRKRRDHEATGIGAPISRYLPHFTVHFASIAFRNNNRTRDLRNCTGLDQKDLSEENAGMTIDELKSKPEENTNVRRILEKKAKSVEYFFPQYKKYDLDCEDGIFTPWQMGEDSAANKNKPEDKSESVNSSALVDFGKYSPTINRDKVKKAINESKTNESTKFVGNSSPKITADDSQPVTSSIFKRDSREILRSEKTYASKMYYPNNTSPINRDVDSKMKNQTVNDLKINKTYIPSNARCDCKRNVDDRNRIIVYVETPGIKKSKSLGTKCNSTACKELACENDIKETIDKRKDQKSTGEPTDWSAKRATKIDEFSKIHYPKETRAAFMVMINDMKKSQLESGKVQGDAYDTFEENVRKFNKMCKTYKSGDEGEGNGRHRSVDEKKNGENTARGEIKSLFKRDDTKTRSESSLSKGISCRSIFYDKSKKDDVRHCGKRYRNKSPSICKRNSSSFIESSTSLSTNVSYCQVQRLFQSMIKESKTGRLKRFRRNISGYKEMDRLGLGTWENKQWRPSDSKAYSIYSRFQRNVDGFQGDFNRCRRKIE